MPNLCPTMATVGLVSRHTALQSCLDNLLHQASKAPSLEVQMQAQVHFKKLWLPAAKASLRTCRYSSRPSQAATPRRLRLCMIRIDRWADCLCVPACLPVQVFILRGAGTVCRQRPLRGAHCIRQLTLLQGLTS